MNTESIILLPGWGLDQQIWSPLQSELEKQYQLYFINWQGIHKISDFKQRVSDLIAEEKLQSFFLLGCSLGSIVALDIALNYPKEVLGIILLGGTSRFTIDPENGYDSGWPARIVERMKKNIKRDRRKTLLSFYKSMFSESEITKGELEKFLSLGGYKIHEDDEESLVLGLDYLNQMDCRSELVKILSPLLLIHGEEDQVCPRTAAAYILKQLSGNTVLKTLPFTGHLPFITQTEKCNEWIQTFIAASLQSGPNDKYEIKGDFI